MMKKQTENKPNLDGSVTASQDFDNYVREEPAQQGTKAIDLSTLMLSNWEKEITGFQIQVNWD